MFSLRTLVHKYHKNMSAAVPVLPTTRVDQQSCTAEIYYTKPIGPTSIPVFNLVYSAASLKSIHSCKLRCVQLAQFVSVYSLFFFLLVRQKKVARSQQKSLYRWRVQGGLVGVNPHDLTDEKFAASMGRQNAKRLSASGGFAPWPPTTGGFRHVQHVRFVLDVCYSSWDFLRLQNSRKRQICRFHGTLKI